MCQGAPRWCTIPGTMNTTPTRVFSSRPEPRWGAALSRTPTLNARYYIPAWENQIPVLGGQYSHRSFDTGRFAGKHVVFGNLEVRHDLLPFGDLGAVTLLAFLDAGRVFEEPFKVTTKDMKVGGGGGVALRILRSSIFTFNFEIGRAHV